MRFHADHGVLRGDEVVRRPAEHLGGDVELGELLFLMLEVFRAHVFQQAGVSSAPAQKLDGPLQFLPFSVARVHVGRYDFGGFPVTAEV